MRLGHDHARHAPKRRRVPRAQLGLEVLPLVPQLSVRELDRAGDTDARQLRFIEPVAAAPPLGCNFAQVQRDQPRLASEALQLRMTRVAARAAGEHRLREQTLAPERDQPLRVEILRMHRPEAHQVLSNTFCDLTTRYPSRS